MIPWRDVARRLAEGEKPGAIAAGLAIDEERIWRHLRKSLRFRTYLRQAIERQKYLADLLLEGTGRSAMVALGRQPENLDGGMLRCLLDEAGRTAEADAPALARRIERLGETGAPPPNMAFRRRMAEEKRRMDQQVEIWRIEDAARAAMQAPAAQPAAPTPGEPQRNQTNANEPERSETNANEAKRTETNINEHQRSAANPDQPRRTTRLRWTRPFVRPGEPRHPPIVDQNSPDPAHLPAEGQSNGGAGSGTGRGGVPDS
jgi:hypothetical protein